MSDQKRKVTGQFNALLRYKASVDLFHVLADLGVEAALAHEGALSLHQNAPKGLREIKVVVKYEAELAMGTEDICNKVVAHPNGYRFSNKAKNGVLGLEYDPMDPSMDRKKCRVEFALSGDPFPIILEDFDEVLCIQGIPVMPVHAILLQQVLLMSESDPAKRREVSVALVQDCLDAIGDVVSEQLSPQWNSRRVLDAIKLLVLQKPGRNPSQWIKLGVNPHIFRAAGPGTITTGPPLSQITARAPKTSVEDESPSPTTDISLLPAQNPIPATDHGLSPGVMETAPTVPENNRVVVSLVAKVVVSALSALGFDSAIFGSTACQLYGNNRTPGDLDILVLPPEPFHQDQEWIKQQIVNRYPAHFALRPGKTPGATYRVLFYKFGDHGSTPPNVLRHRLEGKLARSPIPHPVGTEATGMGRPPREL
ncbi:hypothetical protein H1R20_g10443, partial [Candolleomyces eurysporus]